MAASSTSSRLAAAGRPRVGDVVVSATRPPMLRGGGAGADRAGDARPADPAVAAGVLGEVLLVVVLGVVERTGLGDLGGDIAQAALVQRGLIALARGARGL